MNICNLGFAQSAAAEPLCADLSSPKAVVTCALSSHPTTRMSAAAIAEANQGIGVARQIPNPELNNQTVFGGESSSDHYAEFNLAQPIELGGKRSARIKRAEAETRLSKALQIGDQEEVYVATLLALYRLRQLRDELGALDDALHTFARMSKQFRQRPKLSPEQRASLRIFEIAEQDYRLRRSSLESETDKWLRELELATGHENFKPQDSALPLRKKSWPALPADSPEGNGSKLLKAEASLERARSELDGARSLAWPDLKIGPTVTMQRRLGLSYDAYGFNLSMPLPVFHRNSSGVAMAQRGLDRATIGVQMSEHENTDQRAHFRKRYENAVNALTQTVSAAELTKKHEEVEKLFNQGFLNGTLLVEVHRQVIEFLQTQDEQELSAVESRIRFYALDGRLMEVEP